MNAVTQRLDRLRHHRAARPVAALLSLLLVGTALGIWFSRPTVGGSGGVPGAAPSASGQVGSATAAPSVSSSPSVSPQAPSGPVLRWRPKIVGGQRWQLQLSGRVDHSIAADVYDVDAVETSAADVARLHARGAKVICYVNAGAYEDWRPDHARFPAAVLGQPLDGWAGERWLDIRRWDLLAPIMKARFAVCRSKGFDAIDPDNVDGYTQRSGFTISAAQQLSYNRNLAALARSMGLAIGLKNDLEQVGALASTFDFAVNESCVRYRECTMLRPFIAARKPVFHVEYEGTPSLVCRATNQLSFTSVYKRLNLGPWLYRC